jgi:hypothetical protein
MSFRMTVLFLFFLDSLKPRQSQETHTRSVAEAMECKRPFVKRLRNGDDDSMNIGSFEKFITLNHTLLVNTGCLSLFVSNFPNPHQNNAINNPGYIGSTPNQ